MIDVTQRSYGHGDSIAVYSVMDPLFRMWSKMTTPVDLNENFIQMPSPLRWAMQGNEARFLISAANTGPLQNVRT